jgi:hypothetical protein
VLEGNGIPHAPLEARRSPRVGLVRAIFIVTRSKKFSTTLGCPPVT